MFSSLRNRVPSAPYRFPVQTTTSQYHSKCCVTAKNRAMKSAVNACSTNYDQLKKNDEVIQDEIWKNSCSKEKSCEAKWEQTWGFLKNYDQKGNLKQPKEFVDQDRTLFSSKVPGTTNGHYGQRVKSANSSFMQRLERTPHNLKKNEELLYYN